MDHPLCKLEPLWIFFPITWDSDIINFMSNNHAKYEIKSPPPSFRLWPETFFGTTDLFLPLAANVFVMILA
jgi:hypothetical protein